MKIHPDGTLEGTPEELAQYHRAMGHGSAPIFPTVRPVRPRPPARPPYFIPGDPPWNPTPWPQMPRRRYYSIEDSPVIW